MEALMGLIFPASMDVFLLVMLRVTSLLFVSQIFGRKNLPNIAKIGLCFMVAYIIYVARPQSAPEYQGALQYAMLCAKELIFGLVLGFVTQLFFTLTYTAGHFMDMQMGFSMVNVFDPQSNVQVPVTGNLLHLVVLIVFFTVDGHLRLMEMIYATFITVPVGLVSVSPALAGVAVSLFAKTFLLAVNVSMPLVAAGLLAEVSLGIIVRTVPQINVFVVGLPLKVLLGLLMLVVILPIFVNFTNTLFDEMYVGIELMFRGLVP